MKIKKVLLPIFALLVLASCNKEIETYEKKDVKVDSVFDNIEKKSEEEMPEEKKEEEKDNENKEENQPQPEENNNDNNKNNNENNNNNQNQAAQTRQTIGLVNMRETPNTYEENFILSIPQGNRVEFIEEVYQDGVAWSKIKYQNTVGFVRSDLLR